MIFLSKDLKIIEKKNFHLRRNGSFSVPFIYKALRGYEEIKWRKLKYYLFATALFNGCCESLDFIGFFED